MCNPKCITDYRPISCCNVLYNYVSKIIADRIKEGLNIIVNENQSSFVPGRRISDSILLTQELMKNNHIDRGISRCAFKIDIQKVYDNVNWSFLKNILGCFGFHTKMIDWIMICVSTTTFSINVNGELHGFFKGERGLHQGDPISPYLFTLVMEVLTLMLKRSVKEYSNFRFHPKCEDLKILNLCFVDDLCFRMGMWFPLKRS